MKLLQKIIEHGVVGTPNFVAKLDRSAGNLETYYLQSASEGGGSFVELRPAVQVVSVRIEINCRTRVGVCTEFENCSVEIFTFGVRSVSETEKLVFMLPFHTRISKYRQGLNLFVKYILLVMLLQLSHFPPLIPLHPELPLPPAFLPFR